MASNKSIIEIEDDIDGDLGESRNMLAPRFLSALHASRRTMSRIEDIWLLSLTSFLTAGSLVLLALLYPAARTNGYFYIPFSFLLVLTVGLLAICAWKVRGMCRRSRSGACAGAAPGLQESPWVRTSSIEHVRMGAPASGEDDVSMTSLMIATSSGRLNSDSILEAATSGVCGETEHQSNGKSRTSSKSPGGVETQSNDPPRASYKETDL